MAELNQNSGSNQSGRSRSIKSLPRVDLTAMVDLAFLLITFFMLTTSLSKPNAMHIAVPLSEINPQPIADDRTMTVCLGANNTALWYMGTVDNPQDIHFTEPSKIRSAFREQMKNVLKKTKKDIIVLVKPAPESNFKNLVDVLDEIAIVNVPTYAIVDITANDKKMLIGR